jgi:cytochrome b subunit of formate dehydrogenase
VKPRHLIVGKNLATAAALLTETALLSILLTWIANAWHVLPFVFPLAFTGAAIQLAVGNVVSVVAPLRLPGVGTDIFAQASEQGCLSVGAQVVSFFLMTALMVLPVSAFALTVSFGQALSPWIAIAFSLMWGATIYTLGMAVSVQVLKRRLPEIVTMVQTF